MEFKVVISSPTLVSCPRINRNIMEFKGTNERMGRKMFSKRINRNIMEFKGISNGV